MDPGIKRAIFQGLALIVAGPARRTPSLSQLNSVFTNTGKSTSRTSASLPVVTLCQGTLSPAERRASLKSSLLPSRNPIGPEPTCGTPSPQRTSMTIGDEGSSENVWPSGQKAAPGRSSAARSSSAGLLTSSSQHGTPASSSAFHASRGSQPLSGLPRTVPTKATDSMCRIRVAPTMAEAAGSLDMGDHPDRDGQSVGPNAP